MVPRWLAAAALFVLGFGATLGASGYLAAPRGRGAAGAADALETRQRESQRSLQAALGQAEGGASFLAQLDARIDERLQSRQTRERESFERQLAAWQERADVRRRADMAQVAASLSYLDGRHGQQLAAHERAARATFPQASDKAMKAARSALALALGLGALGTGVPAAAQQPRKVAPEAGPTGAAQPVA